MQLILIALIAASVALAGCAGGASSGATAALPPIKPGIPVQLTDRERATVERGVRSSLKDPDSAKFGEMRAVRDEKGELFVCGMVNAKNSYGGYTGSQPFQGFMAGDAAKQAFITIGVGGDAIKTQVTETMCREQGIDVLTMSPV